MNKKNINNYYMNKILLIRILGNDLSGLHGENQTFTNLKFTLEHEPNFPNTDKMFLLNRIYDVKKKNALIKILKKYNIKFIDLPFKIEKFKKIKYNKEIIENKNRNNRREFMKSLLPYNLYLINNNGSRNYCLNYGKKNGYKWILPLDSNAYFTSEMFNNIFNNIKDDTHYIILPQLRLSEKNLPNEIVLDKKFNYKELKTYEPQIGFNINSKISFNDKLPYGSSPKAELLRVLNIPGKWDKWLDNRTVFGIRDRPKQNAKYQIISYVIRLNSQTNKLVNITDNYFLRTKGLTKLIFKIRNENNDNNIEGFSNIKKLNFNLQLLLLVILIILICYKIRY